MPPFDASGTACCCADQQLPDQIQAAWDCIVWCHFKIHEHFKVHFSYLSHLQRTQVHAVASTRLLMAMDTWLGTLARVMKIMLILLCQKQVILHTRWSAFIWRMPSYIQVLLRLCLFATLDLIFRCDQLFDFLCYVAQVSYYVNKKSECFPLQFVVYIVTVLKFEAIFLLVCISKPTFFSRVGNDKCI